jgi:hypothetical protein
LFNKQKKQGASATLRERPRAERSRSPTSPAAIIGQNWLIVDKPGFDSAQPSVNDIGARSELPTFANSQIYIHPEIAVLSSPISESRYFSSIFKILATENSLEAPLGFITPKGSIDSGVVDLLPLFVLFDQQFFPLITLILQF